MSFETITLALSALTVGVVHTALGPDHYVPLVALAKARGWSLRRTLAVTGWCGLAHIAGSFLLGLLGLFVGMAASRIEGVESWRGDTAAMLLTFIGLVYCLWGIYFGARNTRAQAGETAHHHGKMTFALFVVFVLGPCEALVPILMYPAATAPTHFDRAIAISMVVFAFSLATVVTMLFCVAGLYLGLQRNRLVGITRFQHAWAGFAVLCCGLAVQLGA